KIEKTTLNIGRIINGLRTFSRDGSRDGFAPSSIKEIIEGTLGLCGEKIKKSGVDVQYSLPDGDLIFNCRATQVSQVLLNLIQNSFDAVESLPEKWIKVEAKKVDENLILKVTDSGKGLSEEAQQKMFQPFFTTKDVGRGTGLGLSISKGLIESHAGTITLDNQAPNPSCIIKIPIKQKGDS
ncbi:MAG: ATP-binding protein, partial [Bdellovibrionota bacterium]